MIVRLFGERYGLNVQQAFRYLYSFRGLQHLNEHYEIEHTLSVEDTIYGLVQVCKRNGGQLE